MSELQFKKLFEPIRIGQMRLKNRIVMSSMGTKYSVDHGHVSQRQIDYYEARAKGGVGLINTEMTAISSTGRHRDSQAAISDDSYIPGFHSLAEAVHKHGAKIAVQLNHAGREIDTASTGFPPVGPSAVPTTSGIIPHVLTTEEIAEIVQQFSAAARRAKEAGIDGVEIHAAHSYLLASFISGAFNKRTDNYGGTIQNRARFLIEVIQAIRKVVSTDYPVWFRMNGQEFGLENCLTIGEARQVAKMAVDAGAQAIHVSAYGWGAYVTKAPHALAPGVLLPLAEEIKKAVSVPVIAVGRLDPELAERAIEEGKADLIAMGRRLLADPELPNKVFELRLQDINPCIVCMECGPRSNIPISCTVNAATGRERELRITPADKTKRVVVVGGGPAGMETARVAALRGHQVTLFEKESKLGGLLSIAAKPPHKEELLPLLGYLSRQVEKAGVDIRLKTEATAESIIENKPDVVIIASGGTPAIPDIAGINRANVVTVEDVLSGKSKTGKNVIIIGGGIVGCETGNFLADKGKNVTILEIQKNMAQDMWPSLKVRLMNDLIGEKVAMLTGTVCEKIETDGVIITTNDSGKRKIPADTIIIAVGYKANDNLFKALQGKAPSIFCIGDSSEPGKISNAILNGNRIALSI
jgi:2,4-dienoyl-CoA reductase-like NADH-dependent reductase (Old Yellow Enzyme family)/thioredoxin reductase